MSAAWLFPDGKKVTAEIDPDGTARVAVELLDEMFRQFGGSRSPGTALTVTDPDGTIYSAVPDGSFWSNSGDRSGVWYEDDDLPYDAEPLYRLRAIR
jgi:hypothetical protein